MDTATLISIIMAIFAISISIAFYLKANDTANKFYDNTYKFTNDVLHKLGIIEAHTSNKNLPPPDRQVNRMKEEIKELANELKRIKQERESIIKDLMDKANLLQKERDSFMHKFKEKDEAMGLIKEQLDDKFIRIDIDPELYSYIKDAANRYPTQIYHSDEDINDKFKSLISSSL